MLLGGLREIICIRISSVTDYCHQYCCGFPISVCHCVNRQSPHFGKQFLLLLGFEDSVFVSLMDCSFFLAIGHTEQHRAVSEWWMDSRGKAPGKWKHIAGVQSEKGVRVQALETPRRKWRSRETKEPGEPQMLTRRELLDGEAVNGVSGCPPVKAERIERI